ncbi:hypothetical protein EYF80_032640 [Liparis tanakae]|uniref:Uncharacterized protein n=1 Tax=Liparis tanakae TaxID=230148 RepID=A0A4Z2GU51_9TELE|nr:hypothetical protein EYF80_032640 [Liparis tanakae]
MSTVAAKPQFVAWVKWVLERSKRRRMRPGPVAVQCSFTNTAPADPGQAPISGPCREPLINL